MGLSECNAAVFATSVGADCAHPSLFVAIECRHSCQHGFSRPIDEIYTLRRGTLVRCSRFTFAFRAARWKPTAAFTTFSASRHSRFTYHTPLCTRASMRSTRCWSTQQRWIQLGAALDFTLRRAERSDSLHRSFRCKEQQGHSRAGACDRWQHVGRVGKHIEPPVGSAADHDNAQYPQYSQYPSTPTVPKVLGQAM